MTNVAIELHANGFGARMVLAGAFLRIERSGINSFLMHGIKGDKEILVSRVTSLQFKPANFFSQGYLQVAFAGGADAKRGMLEAVQDENTVLFSKAQQPAFEALRDALRQRITA